MESFLRKTLPEIAGRLGYEPAWHGIAGYSLAGLFAVYALYRTDVFRRAASVSGSLWYDGFKDFALSTPLAGNVERVCLPPGSREGRTRDSDSRLSRVKECTEALFSRCESLGVRAVFETNPEDHFEDPGERLAKGIRWLADDE